MSSLKVIPLVRADVGCLTRIPLETGAAPKYTLSAEEREALMSFVTLPKNRERIYGWDSRSSADYYSELRCGACHSRDGRPGDRMAILVDEGETGLTPELFPDLTWTGEKLRPRFIDQQVHGELARPMRPWMKARMPAFVVPHSRFGDGLAAEHGMQSDFEDRGIDPERAKIGEQLTLKENLDCRQCHAIGDLQPMGDDKTKLAPGINFAFMKDRLRHDYYSRFVLDPPRWDISTRMPKLAVDGKTTKVAHFYDGDAKKQFEAIWNYILSVEQPSAKHPDKKPD